ncbi:MAG: hypothetical protein Q8L74_14420 [Nitrospirota bacterium]|nr:hypothetical protein [Nitrospirota bacterium]MDP2384360.1 hypothetical protein [Nitrospirota bacterium]MDP3596865.1 hypothetical protein [Nitrospirota bacterium]
MANQDYSAAQLDQLSRALLLLHKTLLDGERVAYERVHGRIASNGEFLQLLLGHAWFAWLRQLSQSMAQLDELAGSKEPVAPGTIHERIASMRALLTPSETGEGFGRHYYDAMQRDPDVVLAHAAIKELLR